MANDKVDDGADLGLGGRVWSGALLLEFLRQLAGKFRLKIETCSGRLIFSVKPS